MLKTALPWLVLKMNATANWLPHQTEQRNGDEVPSQPEEQTPWRRGCEPCLNRRILAQKLSRNLRIDNRSLLKV
jgi:hypothetical protein